LPNVIHVPLLTNVVAAEFAAAETFVPNKEYTAHNTAAAAVTAAVTAAALLSPLQLEA
jgi:hypothetical protein